ncbi:hypothetical protein JCM3774_002811 [Rhodotorula dairenensis]
MLEMHSDLLKAVAASTLEREKLSETVSRLEVAHNGLILQYHELLHDHVGTLHQIETLRAERDHLYEQDMRISLERELSAGSWSANAVDRSLATLVIGIFLIGVLGRFVKFKSGVPGPGQQNQQKPANGATTAVEVTAFKGTASWHDTKMRVPGCGNTLQHRVADSGPTRGDSPIANTADRDRHREELKQSYDATSSVSTEALFESEQL